MLTSDFAGPASAARAAGRLYGGSGTLPAGINPRTLRAGQPVRVGAAANENFKGPLPQLGKTSAEPLPLKPLAAAAGLAGTLGAAEFMGPVAGWGVRKTLGKLPGNVGKAFYNVGSVPAAPVNALYQTRFGDLFSRQGLKQLYANFMGTADNYAHGGHVTMHGLEGEKAAHYWKNTPGELPYLQGQMVPQYERSWNPLKGFRKVVEGREQLQPSGKAWNFWGKEAQRFAGEGIVPKAYEATAIEGETMLARLGSRIMNGRAMGVLLKGGLVAAVGLLGIKLTQHFAGQVAQAQEMHKDLTGKDVSAWQLLMNPSKLPPVTQHIRASLIENSAPGAAHVLGEGLDKYAMADGLRGFKFVPMMAGQLIGHSMSGFTPSSDFLGSYHAVKQAQSMGAAAPVEAYAALMEAASLDVRKNGGKSAPLVLKIAESFAEQKTSAADVVKEIEARKPFIARAQNAQAVLLAEEKAAEAAQQSAVPEQNVASQQEIAATQQHADAPSTKVSAKISPDAAMEHQGRVVDAQRQVGA